jgi:DNA polymerase III alpha subunit (gram-positive type)
MVTDNELVRDAQALALSKEARGLYQDLGNEYAIDSREAYEEAAQLLKQIKGKANDLESRRVHLKAPALEAGRRIDEFFKQPLAFLKGAETAVKKAMLSFRKAQEDHAKMLQRVADEAAAVAQRQLARAALEARMKADVEAQALEREARAVKDQAQREKLNLEAQARNARAQEAGRQLEAQADQIKAPVIEADKPRIAGQQIRKIWRWRVVDFAAVPDEYKALDEQAVRAYLARNVFHVIEGRGFKRVNPVPIPGLELYEDEIIATEGTK